MFGHGDYSARLHARRDAVLGRLPDRHPGSGGHNRRTRLTASAAAVALLGGLVVTSVGGLGAQAAPVVGQGFTVSAADLSFILDQIKIGEAHVVNTTVDTGPCGALLGNGPDQIPSPLLSFGIRTVDGSCNNLQEDQDKFGAADQAFPRLTTPVFNVAESNPPQFGPPGPVTSYAQTSGSVFDSEPRTISNLIVDQTSDNPAAVAAAGFPVRTQGNPGVEVCTIPPSPEDPDGTPNGCVPEHQTLFIPNVTTDVGLSPPFNGLFTIFGQFFDHGLDKITNGGAGTVFVPLKDDDPLVTLGPDGVPNTDDELGVNDPRFMTLTRGSIVTGPDGFRSAPNTDTPFVDQSQTYTSHSSHQFFLREYSTDGPDFLADTADDRLVATGKFLSRPDGNGMANWSEIKTQAAELLGIQLVDTDVNDIPLISVDPYGNFIPGPARGMPVMMFLGPDGLAGTPDDFGTEGDINAPISTNGAIRIGAAFLNDIAHSAGPGAIGSAKTPDGDDVAGNSLDTPAAGEYDDELLDIHFICGDGRCNENIALTAVHQMFHAEHDRLIDDIKATLALTENADLLAAFQATSETTFEYGERLFQAARFVTEMEYQHLVFEEFARKVQPAINPFEPFAFNQTDVNPAITAEFAHAVYRFGHSMLTETIDRVAPDGTHYDIPLLDGFLNPASYYDGQDPLGTEDSRAAATDIIMGMSDQVGNEIDEFVTNTLRNNLLGLPLDLPAINMTRARSEGIPSLNNLRKQIFAATNDGQLAPYENWVSFGQALKHPESLMNFIAAYGTHETILFKDGGPDLDFSTVNDNTPADLASRRAAAKVIVSPEIGENPPADADDFLFSSGTWANSEDGVSPTGLDDIDLWVGGLAENTLVFGGLLGSTFNYVFENQLTNLQNGDRFYYLARTPGMNLRAQLEGNSFAELVMRNTEAYSLKADPFATADCKFHLATITWPAQPSDAIQGAGSVHNDPSTECDENRLLLRQPTGRIEYRAINTVDPSGINGQAVYDGTDPSPTRNGIDLIFGGNDNDTFWGREGNDVIDGRGGDDVVLGGEGNDIITDLGGFDVLKGGPGNDAIDGGVLDDIIMGGEGNDFTNGGANNDEHFMGGGNDFTIGGQGFSAVFGDSGDDWMEGGDMADLLIGDSSTLFFDDHNIPGHDVTIGQGGDDDYDTEGGDDIMVGGPGVEKNAGAAGFDWLIGLNDPQAQFADLNLRILPEGQPAIEVRDRFNEVESLSGWNLNDQLFGDDNAPAATGGGGFIGCDVLDQDGLDRIAGLDPLVPQLVTDSAPIIAAATTRYCMLEGNVWGDGNILLGGAGSDTIEGRGADDIIDGDRYVSVRLSIRTNPDGTGAEIASTPLMENIPTGAGWTGALAGKTLQQAVFAGLIDPGRIVIVREVVTPPTVAANCVAAVKVDCDTAVFSGPRADYDVTFAPATAFSLAGIIVNHARGTATDGIDTLRNIDQLRFTDQTVALPRANANPTSLAFAPRVVLGSSSAAQPVTVKNVGGGSLTVSAVAITGPNAASFSQTSNCTGTLLPAGCTVNVTFRPTVAGPLTATLNVFSNDLASPATVALTGTGIANSLVTGVPVISDTTPTEGTAITVDTSGIADANGLGAFTIQWRQSNVGGGGALTNIALANNATFTPTSAQTNRRLAVTVTFTDGIGFNETTTSTSTTVVGDLFPGVGDDNSGINTLAGTAGQDEYHGGASADSLTTGAEDDIVSGDAGDDTINTGAGDDTITFSGTGEGFDAITGAGGGDVILALIDGTNIGLHSLATVENIDANGKAGVRILGSTVTDVLSFANVTLTGIVAIDGGGGSDTITGSAAADQIIGREGLDTLNGGIGNDIIEGGAGDDTMNGNAGLNRFRYLTIAGGFGNDTINGFDANATGGQDLIDLSQAGISAGASFTANVSITNANIPGTNRTLITISGQGSILLVGVGVAAVNVTDFILAP